MEFVCIVRVAGCWINDFEVWEKPLGVHRSHPKYVPWMKRWSLAVRTSWHKDASFCWWSGIIIIHVEMSGDRVPPWHCCETEHWHIFSRTVFWWPDADLHGIGRWQLCRLHRQSNACLDRSAPIRCVAQCRALVGTAETWMGFVWRKSQMCCALLVFYTKSPNMFSEARVLFWLWWKLRKAPRIPKPRKAMRLGR